MSTQATPTRTPETGDPLPVGERALLHSAAALFKALADPLRLELVARTRAAPGGEVCFCDLIEALDMPQSSLSHHLQVLVAAGILTRERRRTWSWYRLQPDALAVLDDALDPYGQLAAGIAQQLEYLRPADDTVTASADRCP